MSEAPCADALDDLMDEYEMELTPAQQLNLIGPGGYTGPCGESDNLVELVNQELFDNLNEELDLSDNECLKDASPAQLTKIQNLYNNLDMSSSVTYQLAIINAFADKLCENPDFEIDLPGLTECENDLIASNPGSALVVAKNTIEALLMTKILFDTIWGSNSCPDAFRHAFYSAINTANLGAELAEQFGDAHECGNGPDLASATAMDLYNNSVGRDIVSSVQPTLSFERIVLSVCTALRQGDLQILTDINDTTSSPIPSTACSCG
jgi:hypothetical protein